MTPEKIEEKPTTDAKDKDAKDAKDAKDNKNEKIIHVKHTFEQITKPEKKEEPKDEKPAGQPEKPEKPETKKAPEKNPEDTGNKPEPKDEKIKKLEGKLHEREAQLGTMVLKEFEVAKKALLDQVKDEKKREGIDKFIGDDPEKLEQVKLWTSVLTTSLGVGNVKVEGKPNEKPDPKNKDTKDTKDTKDSKDGKDNKDNKKPETEGDKNPEDTETPPPKGIVGLPKADAKFADGRRIIDECYEILADPTKSASEKEKANQKIGIMLSSMMKGRKKAREMGKGTYQHFEFRKCPDCGYLIQGPKDGTNECPSCGWKLIRSKASIAR